MMKKIIALALALSMALSMVAFAGYTDADLINTDLTADIELVKALGLMTGNPDGSFNPKGTLTRGEAAVIVYRLSSLKKDIDTSWGDASLNGFTDMAGHWSAPYVNYCAALGLILGDPAGTFRPNDAVTAVEMAKMLLNAAGYDTEKQGYGKNWPAAVLADASNAGLFADFESAYTAPAAREWVAKMVANLLTKVQTVSYNVYTNALVKNVVNGTNNPSIFGAEKYNYKVASDIATANNTLKLAASGTIGTDTVQAENTKTSTVGSYTLTYDIPAELLGHKVNVYYVDSDYVANDSNTHGLTAGDKVYAVIDAAADEIETTMDKVIYKKNTTTNKFELIVAGVVVDADVEAKATIYNSFVAGGNAPFGTDALADIRPVTLVKNGEAWTALVNEVVYTTVTKNDATDGFKTNALNVAKDKVAEKVVFNDTVAKDDVVAIEKLADGTYLVSKLTPAVTKINSVQVADKSFKVGDTVYKTYAATKDGFSMTTFTGTDLVVDGALKLNYNIYTEGGYVVYAAAVGSVTPPVLSADLAYLVAGLKGSGSNDAFGTATPDKVHVMLKDGSFGVWEYKIPTGTTGAVDLFDGVDAGANLSSGLDKVYAYVDNGDGTIYFKSTVVNNGTKASEDAAGSFAYNTTDASKSVLTVTADSGKFYVTADTIFFVKMKNTDNEIVYTVVNASEIKANASTTASAGVASSNGLNSLVYAVVDLGSATTLPGQAATSEADDYFFLTATLTVNKELVDGKEVTTYAAAGIDSTGKKVTLNLASDKLFNASTNQLTDNAIAAVVDTHSKVAMYSVVEYDGKTYLADFDYETVVKTSLQNPADGWYKGAVSASSETWIQVLDGTLYDLAEDASVYSLTCKTVEGKCSFSAAAVTKIPHSNASTGANAEQVLFRLKTLDDGSVVVTDLIITYTKAGDATAVFAGVDSVIK